MTLFGISLRKPTFTEITAAGVMGTGLWLACIGMATASGNPLDRIEAGALLIVIAWACVAVRVGLSIDQGQRHFVANLAISAVLLGLYNGALTMVA